ncbi:hypothetical protein MauCBS54593_005966, partial [Microsporum audouinii]
QLAACAVASASTAGELVSLAIEAVVIAYRTGLHVTKTRRLLENDTDRNKNWSYIVPKLQVDLAASRIEQFSQSANLPIGFRPFIGIVAPCSVTICGPPRVLEDLFNSPIMGDVKPIPAPVFAPYHDSHLHTESDIEEILGTLPETAAKTATKLPVVSSVTGEHIRASTFGALLHTSLGEILREPLRLDIITKSINTAARASLCARWVILSVGANASQSLASALSEIEGISAKVEHIESNPNLDTPHLETRCSGRPEQSNIAIIGYAGRFPEAADADSLWKLLCEGRDVHREIPPDRFNLNTHYHPTGKKKNTSQVRYGCFINEPGLFDCRFFNISPKEADQSDPSQRLALLTAYEALEMAGVVPDRTPSTQRDRVGIFYGMTSDDWREVNSGQSIGTYFIPGGNRALLRAGGGPARKGLKPYTCDRKVLRDILLTGLEDKISYGKELARYEVVTGAVIAYFQDGTTAGGRFLVGADGRGSVMRRQFLPDNGPLDTEGMCIYGKTLITPELVEWFPARAMRWMTLVVDRTPITQTLDFDDTAVTLLLEPIRFPRRNDGFDEYVPADYMYWVLIARKHVFNLPDGVPLSIYTGADAAAISLRVTDCWDPRIRSILHLQDKRQSSLLRVLSASPDIKPWVPSDKATVIGDAVHAMSPCGGVGAVTALVDGASLARTIATEGISVESIGEFEKAMREFAGASIRRSYIGGRKLFGQKPFEECSQYIG